MKKIVSQIQKMPTSIKILSSKSLGVDCPSVDAHISELNAVLSDSSKLSISMASSLIVHLGVYSGEKTKKIRFEKLCFNEKKIGGFFSSPIDSFSSKGTSFECLLPIEDILKSTRGGFDSSSILGKYKLETNFDPGRFLCNYIYYCSNRSFAPKGIPGVFIHVPQITEEAEIETMALIILKFIEACFNYLSNKKQWV